MLQLEARSVCTVVAGMSGSGKTTFALRYLASQAASARLFLFDPESEFASRMGICASETWAEADYILAREGICIFDPHALYPGNLATAADDFCGYVFARASLAGGRNILLLDEAWKYCDRLALPRSLATCVQTGRKRGLETLFTTQLPHKLNGSILNELTELVCFTLGEAKALDCIAERGAPREEVAALPLGSFFALNKHTRGVLRGRVF